MSPPTLKYLHDVNGVTFLRCECISCGHHKVPIKSLPAQATVPSLKSTPCPKCGKEVKSWMPDWSFAQPTYEMVGRWGKKNAP